MFPRVRKSQTKPDFYTKMSIALKESNETLYWLKLLYRTDYLTKKEFESIYSDAKELVALLTSLCKTVSENK